MLKISNSQEITISQGDSVIIDVTIEGAEDYDVDTVIFRLANSETVLSKEIESGQLKLYTEDTQTLSPGYYNYDISVTFDGGEKYTLNYPNKFKIERVC